MKNLLNKITTSFKAALKGEESTHNLIVWWGIIGYVVAYFIMNRLVLMINFRVSDIIVSLIAIIYFAWHIYVLKKCSPKKPKLSKEEKRRLREVEGRTLGKVFMRKLFLQEPLTQWNPVFVTIIIDIFCIANFVDYITR